MDILKKLPYLLSLLLLLTSCMEDFDPNVGTRPVLCLNSVITAGEPVVVNVTHTWFFTDTAGADDHAVKDAEVRIYANGLLVDQSEWVPQPGDLVRIEATSPTYGDAWAEVKVPLAPTAEIISADPELLQSWPFSADMFEVGQIIDFNIKVQLRVHDSNPVSEYYHIGFAGIGTGAILDDHGEQIMASDLLTGEINYDAEPIFSEHISEFDYVTGSDAYGFTFFTDRQFTGSSYTLHLDFSNMEYRIQAAQYDPSLIVCEMAFTLSSVSESYYNYVNYRWQTDDGLFGDLGDIGFTDPVWAYSNVSTGAGLVCARTPLTLTVDLRDFILAYIVQR